MKQVTIYTDGACKGNPGPGGWGALLESQVKGKTYRKELYGGAAETTNNQMELRAVIESLKALKSQCQVEIYLDSQYVRQGITEWMHNWKRNGWRTANKKPVKNIELWQQLDQLVNNNPLQHRINWHWVKGHAGNPGNEQADALANRGTQAYLDLPQAQ